MGDLISRSALIKKIKIPAEWEYHDERRKVFKEVLDYIEKMPTAYDVESVIAELEKSMKESEKDNALFQIASALGEVRAFEYAIKVVRNGGKE